VRLPLKRTAPALVPADDAQLVRALREGDEEAFAGLVDRLGPAMLRLARAYLPSRAVAEEVVQETWLAVVTSIDRFEGRSSLKTWIFRILTNKAKTRAQREGRSIPFSALGGDDEPAVAPERFQPGGAGAGQWAFPPRSLDSVPEERLLGREVRETIAAAIEALPPAQRVVITLRDVEGLSADEACNVLELTEGNQRVLLHRARSKVRAQFEAYLEGAA
jgi:RNA polymerase sigma-70 factor (ECF subfamily)